MKKLINIQGKWYILLGMFSGRYYVCNLFDINNELVYTGIIWYKQPFFYNNDVWYGGMFYKVVKLTRIIKQLIIGDVFGRRRLQAYLESI